MADASGKSDEDSSPTDDPETCRYKNIYAVQVLIPKVFRCVLNWGQLHQKDPSICYMEFLNTHYNYQHSSRLFSETDIENLENSSNTEVFDASLLFKLIQMTCHSLKPKTDKIWMEHNEDCVEQLLWKTKEYRNSVCHDVRTVATSSKIFSNIQSTLKNLLEKVGEFYAIDQSEVVNEIAELDELINDVTLTKEERKRIDLQRKFHTYGFQESKSYWKKYCCMDTILFTGEQIVRDEVFHPLDITIRTISTSECESYDIEVYSYTKIFEPWCDEDKCCITVIQGEAGSGKSTISKNIAQQFFGLSERDIPALKRFHMIHYVECRNQRIKSLEDFLKKSYPDTCRKIGDFDTNDCFSFLGNLVFIDGYDELNRASAIVVQDIVNKVKNFPNCEIIFTTRPHALSELTYWLNREGLAFRVCELLPIIEEHQQIQFIERYAQARKVTKPASDEMVKSFRNLSSELKRFFVYPINLVLYFHLHDSGLGKTLVGVPDVSSQILHQYEVTMKRKFENSGLANLEQMVIEVLDEISIFAFQCLDEDKITLSNEDVRDISSRCGKIFREYGALNFVDINQVLSVIFLCRQCPNPNTHISYQFFHKSVQEMFASKSLVTRLKEENSPTVRLVFAQLLKKSQLGQTLDNNTIKKYLNVLRFAVIALCNLEYEDLLNRHAKELISVIKLMTDRYQYCAQLVHSCNFNEMVVKEAAKAAGNWWGDKDGTLLKATGLMLEHSQPNQIRIFLPIVRHTPEDLESFLMCLTKRFKGGLVLEMQRSHFDYIPCDSHIAALKGAKLRLVRVRCCLTSAKSVKVLLKFARRPEPDLYVSLTRPLEHSLILLHNKPHYLTVRVKYDQHWSPQVSHTKRPLPVGSQPPWLIVEGVPENGGAIAEELIVALSPKNLRYRELELQNCALSSARVLQLVETLSSRGVCTGAATTSWQERRTNRNGVCWGCGKTEHSNGGTCYWLSLRGNATTAKHDTAMSLPDPDEDNVRATNKMETCCFRQPKNVTFF